MGLVHYCKLTRSPPGCRYGECSLTALRTLENFLTVPGVALQALYLREVSHSLGTKSGTKSRTTALEASQALEARSVCGSTVECCVNQMVQIIQTLPSDQVRWFHRSQMLLNGVGAFLTN